MTGDDPLHWWPARRLAAAIRRREISAVEVMHSHLDRIAQLNDSVNAVVSLLPESEAVARARMADAAVRRGDDLGPLHGLPTAVKDLMDVEGFPTTHGSPAHAKDGPASSDSLLAAALRRSGAIIIAKTNTPEFGLGALTFNPVFGATRNPHDQARNAGGSSGGAAASVAAGMLPIADGSDSGGSLRYPAAFCGVVGLRPSPGRIASGRLGNGWTPHGLLGPMARDCRDAGLHLAGVAGAHPIAPLSIDEDPASFAHLAAVELEGLRIGWSDDAGGLPMSSDVRAVHADARDRLERLGCVVVDVEPDLSSADRVWEVIEMFEFFSSGRREVERHGGRIRADYVRNVDAGSKLTADELASALSQRTDLFRETAGLLEQLDVLAFPATPVAAPDVEAEWVDEIDGTRFDRYFEWQKMANRLTVTAHPVLVISAGSTAAGLPVGLQLVGGHRQEHELLSIGAAIEDATPDWHRRPAGEP